ncbi:MAG: acyl-CoA/acyl-ACP dehydrogenase [Proteobacteria bacterium]|nr:acyl-CoA/acyl-ACP dehydrogenase [Pseudomonadota bacterium]
MYFGLSEEQVMIQDSFRGALERAVTLDTIRAVATGETGLDDSLWEELSQLGMPALLISEEFGGAGLSMLEAAVVAQELGRHAAPVPFVGTAVMATLTLNLCGSEAQKSNWLPKMAAGNCKIGVGIGNVASGARRGAAVSVSEKGLSGEIPFVIDAAGANAFLVSDQAGNLYLLNSAAAGLSVSLSPTIDGTNPLGHLTLNNVSVNRLENASAGSLDRIINAGRIALAAQTLGAGEEMLRRAVAYAKERKQFDRVIGSFQAVKHMCAEMAAQLQPCQSLVWYAAYAHDVLPEEASLSTLLAKSRLDDVGRMVARTATEVHGSMGYTDLMGLHFWFKRIGFNRAQLGGPEKLRQEAAELQGLV